jgi:hypothetical protein
LAKPAPKRLGSIRVSDLGAWTRPVAALGVAPEPAPLASCAVAGFCAKSKLELLAKAPCCIFAAAPLFQQAVVFRARRST